MTQQARVAWFTGPGALVVSHDRDPEFVGLNPVLFWNQEKSFNKYKIYKNKIVKVIINIGLTPSESILDLLFC